MKYTKEQRLDIGYQLYTKELSTPEAMEKYDLSRSAVQLCLTDYKRANGIPLQKQTSVQSIRKSHTDTTLDMDAYMAMSKEELINELIRAKVNEARAKKGYEVKGAGADKVYNSINNKNSKS